VKIPVGVKAAGLLVITTLFYTYVSQLVPQKEVPAPQVIEIPKDATTEQLVAIGEVIFEGRGLCSLCHTIGRKGAMRFPDLADIAIHAGERVPEMSAMDYLAQSMYEPDVFVVKGFNPGMPAMNRPPIELTDDETRAVIAYLQTLGGEATITMDTVIPYMTREEATPEEAVEPEPLP
jgi:mono/diheme cytochrome c family protein